jgi:hypothetical protein
MFEDSDGLHTRLGEEGTLDDFRYYARAHDTINANGVMTVGRRAALSAASGPSSLARAATRYASPRPQWRNIKNSSATKIACVRLPGSNPGRSADATTVDGSASRAASTPVPPSRLDARCV